MVILAPLCLLIPNSGPVACPRKASAPEGVEAVGFLGEVPN